MRQGIEKQQKTEEPKTSVTVMFPDRSDHFGCLEPFCARESVVPPLPRDVTVGDVFALSLSSLSTLLTDGLPSRLRRRKTPLASLSSQEKFSTEARNARSVCPVFEAHQDKRGHTAAFKVTNQNTEQRRCAAA